MSGEILESYKIQFLIDGLTKWLGETGFPDIAPLVFAEITEKFGLSQEDTEAILADLD
jgi:hypothetical protein